MKKMISAMALGLALILSVSVEAATSGAGRGNGDTMKVQTKANWYTSGQESITLASRYVGGGRKGTVYEVFDVWIDGAYKGQIGGIGQGISKITKRFLLGRNKTYTFRIKYNHKTTAQLYKQTSGRTLRDNGSHNWNVAATNKIANYW